MEIVTAKSAGFCFGVQRAVETVYEEVEKGGQIYTYGPIIHNREVVSDLEKRGVHVIESAEEIDGIHGGTIIIRSHGVSRDVDERIRATGAKCVDATCPFVKRIHKIVDEASAAGEEVVIIGNPVHPEVFGIKGWSHSEVTVIETHDQAKNCQLDPAKKVCVVSQTTFNANKFEELVAILEQRGYNIRCMNTICNATHERQTEAKEIASRADVMIVIGDQSSSNSAKLYSICEKECPRTQFIQTWRDLNLSLKGHEQMIGITAGASTPKNIIEEVQRHVRTDI